jgi:RNA polymerase sigma factor (sigma-70 family)
VAKSLPDGASDAELVSAARRGSKSAFGELAVRHRSLAVGVCSRFLGEHDPATDVVQEAIVVALVQLHRLADPERFGSWLCGIALNIARQRLRHRHRLAEVPLDAFAFAQVWPAPDGDPAEAAERADLGQRVRLAIAELAPGQRDAVLLFYLQGLTYREVATELDISVNAVKARLHQARSALEPRLVETTAAEQRNRRRPPMVSDTYTDAQVGEVRRSPASDDSLTWRHVIVLEELNGDRRLPIWVGPMQATALALSLEHVEMPRPMTYHFAAALLAGSGASVSEVRITQLREGTFYAVVVVETGADRYEVDARPSDALNLAVVTGTPIRIETALLDDSETQCNYRGWRDYEIATGAIAAEIQAAAVQEHRWLAEESGQ